MKTKKGPHEFKFPTNMGVFTFSYPGDLPVSPDTGNILLPGFLIEKANKALLSRLAAKEGLFSANELKFIFSVLPYDQREIALVTGKVKSTLSHYKSGENPPDFLFCCTLREIIADFCDGNENTMNRLRAMAEAAIRIGIVEMSGTKTIQIA